MEESDTEIDVEKGTTPPGSSGSATETVKTTGSLPNMGVTSSVSICDYMDIELQKAAAENNEDKFNKILGELSENSKLTPASIFETVTPFHSTLLHIASFHGSVKIVKLIVPKCTSTLTKKNLRGETALHTAAKAGQKGTVSSIIELQKQYAKEKNLFQMRNVDGNTALHEALVHCHESVARDLIKADPEVSFCVNKQGKSPLYLAAEAGYSGCVEDMMESEAYQRCTWPCQNGTAKDDQISPSTVEVGDDQKVLKKNDEVGEDNKDMKKNDEVGDDQKDMKKNDEITKQDGVLQVKSPIHAAVVNANKRENPALLNYMLVKEPNFIDLRDEEGRSVLHTAASLGYVEGVKCFLDRDSRVAFQRDNNGFFPIHSAAEGDYVNVINELRPHCLDLSEMVSFNYQNILHSAAKKSGANVVSYVLKTKELEKLINQKDKDGNTALHLAAINCVPLCVILLTRDRRVDKKSLNNENWTALDACRYHRKQDLLRRLTVTILKRSGVKSSQIRKPPDTDANNFKEDDNKFKDVSNALLVVATLVATVTFAAGFTVPGGYNDSGDEQGIAIMLRKATFHAFLVCDTVAMYSSIIAAVIFTLSLLGGEQWASSTYQFALPSLAVALLMMSLAYISGIYVVVSKLSWLAKLILVLGLCFQGIIALSLSFFLVSFLSVSDWGLILMANLFNWVASLIYPSTDSR